MDTNNAVKKTLGRRKIEIKKIEKKTSLQVTFTKRRTGLFRKASELSLLCGSEIAILVQSPAGKIFTFGHPSVDYLIDRFKTRLASAPELGASSSNSAFRPRENEYFSKYAEALTRLETIVKQEKEGGNMGRDGYWWDEEFEGMELHELEEYAEALEKLKDNVLHRVEEIENVKVMNASASSSNILPLTGSDDHGFDQYNVGGFPVHDHQDFDASFNEYLSSLIK